MVSTKVLLLPKPGPTNHDTMTNRVCQTQTCSELTRSGPIPKIRFSKFPGVRTEDHLVNFVFCCIS